MQVSVDRDRCEGHGLCEEAAPEVFQLDAEAELVLLHTEIPGNLERATAAAVKVCPVAALTLQP